MKKLFLISAYFPDKYLKYFLTLSGKQNIKEVRFLLIENAADVYEESKKWFVYETRGMFQDLWIEIDLCNLEEYFSKTAKLKEKLSKYDVIWLGWGNTYHLRYCLQESWFDTLWDFFDEKKLMIGWGSAGALVLCPSLIGYEIVDIPKFAKEYIQSWLWWFPIQIIPHWKDNLLQEKLESIEKIFISSKISYIVLEDRSICFWNANNYEIL